MTEERFTKIMYLILSFTILCLCLFFSIGLYIYPQDFYTPMATRLVIAYYGMFALFFGVMFILIWIKK